MIQLTPTEARALRDYLAAVARPRGEHEQQQLLRWLERLQETKR